MGKIIITEKDLAEQGSRILARDLTTDGVLNYYGWGDSKKPLKFVVAKGFINDWCVYIEDMEAYQDYDKVASNGNKISNIEIVKLLVDCSDEVLKRYRR